MHLISFLLRATKLEVKQAIKNKVFCVSRKAKQCLLQMSRNTLKQVDEVRVTEQAD